MTHICVIKLFILGSDNGLSPGRRQAIIWTKAGILLIGSLGTNFSEILIEIRIFSFKKMGLKVSSAKWRPFCLGLNVSMVYCTQVPFPLSQGMLRQTLGCHWGLRGLVSGTIKGISAPGATQVLRYCYMGNMLSSINILWTRQNGRHFPGSIFKWIFLNENEWNSIKISLKIVPGGPFSYIPALLQVMAWCRIGNKPLSETMMVRVSMHICVTRPQWVNMLSSIHSRNEMP